MKTLVSRLRRTTTIPSSDTAETNEQGLTSVDVGKLLKKQSVRDFMLAVSKKTKQAPVQEQVPATR